MYIGERSCLFVNILVFYVKGKKKYFEREKKQLKHQIIISNPIQHMF